MRPFIFFTFLLLVAVDHLQGKPGRGGKGGMCLSEIEVSHLCLEGTTFETSLIDARGECTSGGGRPQRPHSGKPGQGRDLVENRRSGRYSKCKPVDKVAERWETLFAEENCVLVKT